MLDFFANKYVIDKPSSTVFPLLAHVFQRVALPHCQFDMSLAVQMIQHLASKGLTPTKAWITAFLSTQRPTTPLPALKQTALFRLLASDITSSLDRSNSAILPPDIHEADIQERTLLDPLVLQVLHVDDIGKSKWSHLEALEAAERGETTKGSEIIRVVPGEIDELPEGGFQTSRGPHKLLLQDAAGAAVYALELRSVDGIGAGMSIGTKLVLKDVAVARSLLLLEPATTTVLGGKIDSLDKVWRREERKLWHELLEAGPDEPER